MSETKCREIKKIIKKKIVKHVKTAQNLKTRTEGQEGDRGNGKT